MPLEGGGAVLGIRGETVLYRKHSNSKCDGGIDCPNTLDTC